MILYIKRKLKRFGKKKKPNTPNTLMASIRHECHRIEKSVYNNILNQKIEDFTSKAKNATFLFKQLSMQQKQDPSMEWANKIINAFPDVENSFIAKNKQPVYSFNQNSPSVLLDVMKARRSNRVWAREQPSIETLREHALEMIQAAITAPCSGNRQGVRFKIITNEKERVLLKGIKEYHCYSAPLLIFIGAEKDVYYSLGDSDKNCKYLDAAASAMQIINLATSLNYGTCWNHFDSYMVNSRKSNKEIYKLFTSTLKIASNIEPIAILSIGYPKFIVPTPERMNLDKFILNS